MSDDDMISDEKLNLLIDNELHIEEKQQLLTLIRQDPELAARYQQLRELKDYMLSAYAEPPQALRFSNRQTISRQTSNLALAFSVGFLVLGVAIGWFGNHSFQPIAETPIYKAEELHSQQISKDNVLIHVSSMKPEEVNSALQMAEQIVQHNPLQQVEIVANLEGLGILQENSPYTNKIQTLAKNYNNISFKACGVAKKVAQLKTGKEIILLPEAGDVPSALDQILFRLKHGWVYIKG
ncbi:MAG: hypothetical protein OEZ58_20265 [Gammaproteobacteria bacterium]|nr:hypothetical protein [Gammaproteobacteria bacterium]MDH5731327.1 hypothetical protein [Gammaproteobacteria bacterium]